MGKYTEWATLRQAQIHAITNEGATLAQKTTGEPSATVGVFGESFPAWEPGKTYTKAHTLFTYNGIVGFTRQSNVLAQEHQPPFSPGMEAVYGVRPVPDIHGVYPYVRNMAVIVGMPVRSAKDGQVYVCIQPADPLLYDPVDVPALFEIQSMREE